MICWVWENAENGPIRDHFLEISTRNLILVCKKFLPIFVHNFISRSSWILSHNLAVCATHADDVVWMQCGEWFGNTVHIHLRRRLDLGLRKRENMARLYLIYVIDLQILRSISFVTCPNFGCFFFLFFFFPKLCTYSVALVREVAA